MSEAISLDEIRLDDVITILKKDLYGDVRVHILRVAKIGRKYIYGRHIIHDSGADRESDYLSRIDVDGAVLLRGDRRDLADEEVAWSSRKLEWHERKHSAIRNIESELWDLKVKRIEEWERENPFPKNPLERFFGEKI
jgi:hypothetical protein